MLTEQDKQTYKQLVRQNPHIVQTSEELPVCVPLYEQKTKNKKSTFKAAKEQLLGEFNS